MTFKSPLQAILPGCCFPRPAGTGPSPLAPDLMAPTLPHSDFPQKAAARRWLVHSLAAASGNTASSLVFVPKEVIKQQLQVGECDLEAVAWVGLPCS